MEPRPIQRFRGAIALAWLVAAVALLPREVFLDATVIRMAIGPARLRLAGRWNWWPGR